MYPIKIVIHLIEDSLNTASSVVVPYDLLFTTLPIICDDAKVSILHLFIIRRHGALRPSIIVTIKHDPVTLPPDKLGLIGQNGGCDSGLF